MFENDMMSLVICDNNYLICTNGGLKRELLWRKRTVNATLNFGMPLPKKLRWRFGGLYQSNPGGNGLVGFYRC